MDDPLHDPQGGSRAKRRQADCMGVLAAVERCFDRAPEGDARWTERLLERLPALRSAMREHFEEEERGPLHNELAIHNPHLADQFQSLREEHPRLLDSIDTVIDRAQELRHPKVHELRVLDAHVQLLAARLRRHEAVENELMLEAIYQEIGGQG